MYRGRLISFYFFVAFCCFLAGVCNDGMLQHLKDFQNVSKHWYADYNQVNEIQGDFLEIIKYEKAPKPKVIDEEPLKPVYEFSDIEIQNLFVKIFKILQTTSSCYKSFNLKGIIYPFHFFS